jgi:site-specific recombinase XerD
MFDEIERFVNWVRRRSPHAHTWQDYRSDLQQFARFVGDRPPTAITLADIDHFVLMQADGGMNLATINRRLAAITSFYTFLADEDPDLLCPVLPHRHNLRQRQRMPRPVPEAELNRFLAADEDTIGVIRLITGLRRQRGWLGARNSRRPTS